MLDFGSLCRNQTNFVNRKYQFVDFSFYGCYNGFKGFFMPIKVKKFKNGATLVYRHRKRTYSSVVAGFVFGRNRDKYPEPSAHFLEHMFFQETENRNKKQLSQEQSAILPKSNGGTNLFYTHIVFMRANKAIEPCFKLTSDMLLHTKFSKKLIESEKGVIKQELMGRLNNQNIRFGRAQARSLASQYTNNSYIIGSEEEIEAISAKDLQKFRDDNFISENFLITIEGGISYFKAKRLARKHFINKLKSNPFYPVDHTVQPDFDLKGNMNIESFPISKAKCSIVIKIDESLENIKTEQTLRMLRRLCNQFPGGLLQSKLREKGLVYSAYLSPDCGIKNHWTFNVYWECMPNNFNKCIDTIGQVFKNLRTNLIDAKLVEQEKQQALLAQDETCPAPIYPSKLFDNYLRYGVEYYSKEVKKQSKKCFNSLKPQDIQTLCKNILSNPENIHVTVLTEKTDFDFYDYPTIQKILTGKTK